MWLLCYRFRVYLFVRPFYYHNANRGISVKALYVSKGNCPCWFKRKKKIFIFFAVRFIVSKRLMTRNYPDIITYALL
jgi:hypothetical protein